MEKGLLKKLFLIGITLASLLESGCAGKFCYGRDESLRRTVECNMCREKEKGECSCYANSGCYPIPFIAYEW